MFAFEQARPIGHGSGTVNPADYTFEGDGLLYAFEEAYTELSECDSMIARMNTKAVNEFANGYHQGGYEVATESVNRFMNSQVVQEGFFGDMKTKLINLLKKLKEKIIAFFHSAIQYFDKWFKSEAEFAEKYEEEVNKKDLDGFKYKLYDWNFEAYKPEQDWKKLETAAINAAKKDGVALESFMLDRNDWISLLESLWLDKVTNRTITTTDKFDDAAFRRNPDRYQKLSDNNNIDSKQAGSGINFNGSKISEDPRYKEKSEASKDSETSKDSEASTVKSISSSQKKTVQKVVMNSLGYEGANIEAFKKDVKKKLQGGRNEPKEVEADSKMSQIIDDLKNYKEPFEKIEEARDALVDGIDEKIDSIKDIDEKDKDKKMRYKNHTAILVICKDVYMVMFNAYKECLQARGSQYKSCMSAALHYNKKKD